MIKGETAAEIRSSYDVRGAVTNPCANRDACTFFQNEHAIANVATLSDVRLTGYPGVRLVGLV